MFGKVTNFGSIFWNVLTGITPQPSPGQMYFMNSMSNGLVTRRTQERPKKVLGGLRRSLLGNPGATPDSPQTLYSVYDT